MSAALKQSRQQWKLSTPTPEGFSTSSRSRLKIIERKVLAIFAEGDLWSKLDFWNVKEWKYFLAGLCPQVLEIDFWEDAEKEQTLRDRKEQEELREKLLWRQANPEAWQERIQMISAIRKEQERRRNKPWDDSDMPPDVSLQQTHRKKRKKKRK